MREVSQVGAIVNQSLNSAIFALEGKIVSVSGGKAVVQPVPTRVFGDNDESFPYSEVSNVRLISLVWNSGNSGVSGAVKTGDSCVLIALSHGDGEEPDHKTLSGCVAICGLSDTSLHTMPDDAGVRIFSESANVTLSDNSIKIDNGGGANITLSEGAITLNAPDGYTVNANTQINGNLAIAGDMTTTAGGSGGSGRAAFAGDIQVNGISAAIDHVSGSISGKGHKHQENGDGGGITDEPM